MGGGDSGKQSDFGLVRVLNPLRPFSPEPGVDCWFTLNWEMHEVESVRVQPEPGRGCDLAERGLGTVNAPTCYLSSSEDFFT